MNNEIELLELEKYLQKKGKNYDDENIDEIIQEFLEEYNKKQNTKNKDLSSLTDEEKAYELYDEACNCEEIPKAKRLLRKALKLKPDFLDAKVALASYSDNTLKYIRELYRLEKEEKRKLEMKNYFTENNISHFYEILETRPYIRLLHTIAINYYEMGCLKKAANVFKQIIVLNSNDNLGCRYHLMAIYASLEEEKEFEQILHCYPEKSVPVYLFKTVLYYKLGEFEQAKKHLRSLYHLVPLFKKMMTEKITEEDMENISPLGYYSPFSLEEIMVYIDENAQLFDNTYLLEWLQTELNKMK